MVQARASYACECGARFERKPVKSVCTACGGEFGPLVKLHRCAACLEPFRKLSMGHLACSPACAIALVRKAQELRAQRSAREERRHTRARLEQLKNLNQLHAEAQMAVNSVIRMRDAHEPCISCGRLNLVDPLTGGAWDCGHYRSRGAAPHLRYDERNMAKQCKRCNRDLSGNAAAFRVGLVARIGIAAVESLECDNTAHKWTRDEVRGIRDSYRARLRECRTKKSCLQTTNKGSHP